MPQFFQNCGRGDIRGRPAGRLSFFLGCARGATSRISLSAESEEGAALHLPAFFKRLVGMEGAKPLPRFPQKAKSYPLRLGRNPKRRKGGPQAARGCPRGRNFKEIAA